MEQLNLSEIGFSSDSDDFIEEYWFRSPNASFDGSSVNSIPWAEDVVKQNQELWESIERMFYGEQPLPEHDDKLRNEIMEWTKHFPHLRIVGKSIQNNQPINDGVNQSTQYDYKSVRTLRSHRAIDEKPKSFIADTGLDDDMERCLRITSGPLLVRRTQNRAAYIPRTANQLGIDNRQRSDQPIKKSLKSALVSASSNLDIGRQFGRKLYRSVDSATGHVIPYSAHSVKIPFIKCENMDLGATNANKMNLIRVKTATLVPIHRPLRNSVTLPSINIEPKYLNQPYNSSGPISALIYSVDNRSMFSKRQPTAKKRSESE